MTDAMMSGGPRNQQRDQRQRPSTGCSQRWRLLRLRCRAAGLPTGCYRGQRQAVWSSAASSLCAAGYYSLGLPLILQTGSELWSFYLSVLILVVLGTGSSEAQRQRTLSAGCMTTDAPARRDSGLLRSSTWASTWAQFFGYTADLRPDLAEHESSAWHLGPSALAGCRHDPGS